jgi:predicted DCC family thiol-disulfide oxidoreductase YuxK
MTERLPGCDIEWLDINKEPEALAHRGVEIDEVRRKLYVEDEQGNLHVGAAAFAALWSETPRQRLLSMPGLKTVSRWVYDAFAAVLYAWNRQRGRW